MEIIRTVAWMKQVGRAARQQERPLGLVPTMGALHEGHFSLVRAARAQCSPVVVSLFVNPKQFGPSEDLQKYPRTFEADCAALESLGVDYLFAPPAEEIYPNGFRTAVVVEGLRRATGRAFAPRAFSRRCDGGAETLRDCAAAYCILRPQGRAAASHYFADGARPESRRGDCGVPDRARGGRFGAFVAKCLPERRFAARGDGALSFARCCEARDRGGREKYCAACWKLRRNVFAGEPGVAVDYVEIVDAETLEPVVSLRGTCYVLVAAVVGGTRLIDNALIESDPSEGRGDSFRVTL